MEKIRLPYSFIKEIKDHIKMEVARGTKEYLPKRVGFNQYERLPYQPSFTDSEGRKMDDMTKPLLFFDWDPFKHEWILDSSGLDIDGSK